MYREVKQMNRNDVVNLSDLVEGDRFYKLGDGKRKAMAIRDIKSHPNGDIKSITICTSDDYDKPYKVSFPIISKPAEYQAVFLRHESDVA